MTIMIAWSRGEQLQGPQNYPTESCWICICGTIWKAFWILRLLVAQRIHNESIRSECVTRLEYLSACNRAGHGIGASPTLSAKFSPEIPLTAQFGIPINSLQILPRSRSNSLHALLNPHYSIPYVIFDSHTVSCTFRNICVVIQGVTDVHLCVAPVLADYCSLLCFLT